MSQMLRVLHVEDSNDDSALIRRNLTKGGFEVELTRVDTAKAVQHELSEGRWDVVLCDYTMPSLSAPDVLHLTREMKKHIPVIIVSGTIGEEAAAGCMKSGACDFVHKDNLARLVPVVERELEEAQVRKDKSHAEGELKLAQDTLVRTEKLRALGQMAAGVSHDLKNILNPLSIHLELVERSIAREEPKEARESIAEMKGVLARGVDTLERLRTYSRQETEARTELVELGALVEEAAKIVRPRCSSTNGDGRVLVETRVENSPPILAVSADIVNALVNLTVNAFDAMSKTGGTVTLSCHKVSGGALIQVTDDGPGMSAEVQKRVFEPFFTTKGAEGTGLGLAMVYACVQRHGGHVSLESTPGVGTKFSLFFPETPSVPPKC